VQVGFRLQPDADRTSRIELFHDQQAVGSATIPRTSNHLSFAGLSICGESAWRVARQFPDGRAFPHAALEMLELEFEDEGTADELARVTLAVE
jgi:hypothetical protein